MGQKNMNKTSSLLFALAAACAVTGCSTFVPQRYSLSADSNQALKGIKAGSVSVGQFSGPTEFDPNCRAAGSIEPPDAMTYEAYIRKALIDELKVAGLLQDQGKRSVTVPWAIFVTVENGTPDSAAICFCVIAREARQAMTDS